MDTQPRSVQAGRWVGDISHGFRELWIRHFILVLLNPEERWEQWSRVALQADLYWCKCHAAALSVNCRPTAGGKGIFLPWSLALFEQHRLFPVWTTPTVSHDVYIPTDGNSGQKLCILCFFFLFPSIFAFPHVLWPGCCLTCRFSNAAPDHTGPWRDDPPYCPAVSRDEESAFYSWMHIKASWWLEQAAHPAHLK